MSIHQSYDKQFVEKWWSMLTQFLQTTLQGNNKVVDIQHPAELAKIIDLQINQEPSPQHSLLLQTKKVLQYQTKAYHPHFHNQLFGGFDQYSFLGSITVPSINGCIHTYQMAPCFTIMQHNIFEHMREIVGWPQIDGTMTPGGSLANFYAIHLAKYRLFPQSRNKGIFGTAPLKIFSSDVSHYSLKKGANFTGIGIDNVVPVLTDQIGRMIPEQLQKAIKLQIEQGNKPLMVNLTLGTTVQGSIDPIPQLAQVCAKYGVWCHVDGALGAAFLMSPKLRQTLGSFANVDSITFDPHKALVVPLQATFFLCKHKNLATQCNSLHADYLFHKERASYSTSLDVGDKQLMCGRIADILKLWTYFKGNGWKGIASQVEAEHNLALYIKKYVQERPQRFKMAVSQVQTFNVCFWYLPEKLKLIDFASEKQYYALLSKVTVLAKKYMLEQGKIMFGYSKSKSEYYFWRQVMSNPFNTNQDIDYQMQLLVKYCEKAYEQLTKR